MKKVVNGKMYDTDTAELIDVWDNKYNSNDFHYVEEKLYKTKKGAYFLYGEGGPLSSYAEKCGNGSCGSSDIRPMTKEEAIEWAEKRELTDLFETEFADVVEEA